MSCGKKIIILTDIYVDIYSSLKYSWIQKKKLLNPLYNLYSIYFSLENTILYLLYKNIPPQPALRTTVKHN